MQRVLNRSHYIVKAIFDMCFMEMIYCADEF